MAVSYMVKGDVFVADKPRVWASKLGGTSWDLAPDGKRLFVVTPVAAPEAPKQEHAVVFLQNFFDELRGASPSGNDRREQVQIQAVAGFARSPVTARTCSRN